MLFRWRWSMLGRSWLLSILSFPVIHCNNVMLIFQHVHCVCCKEHPAFSSCEIVQQQQTQHFSNRFSVESSEIEMSEQKLQKYMQWDSTDHRVQRNGETWNYFAKWHREQLVISIIIVFILISRCRVDRHGWSCFSPCLFIKSSAGDFLSSILSFSSLSGLALSLLPFIILFEFS